MDYFEFVQKCDSFENLHIPEDYSVHWDFLISLLMLLNDHTEITVGAILGNNASLESLKPKVLDVIDDVTTLILQFLKQSNLTHDIVFFNHFKHPPFRVIG
jgi:hypothetical protein